MDQLRKNNEKSRFSKAAFWEGGKATRTDGAVIPVVNDIMPA
jgi:hypothetical protein